MKTEIDWMGRWYDIIKERGENDEPTFGKLNLKTNEIEWIRFSHTKMDGVGVLNYFYNNRGIKLSKFPDLKEKKAPGIFEMLFIFFKLLFQNKKVKPKWIETNFQLKPVDVHQLHFHVFKPEEVLKLKRHCKENQFSLCAFIMHEASKVFLNQLSTNHEGTWTLPVNLRPVLKREDYNSNHSSGVLISFHQNKTPMDIHQQIKNALKNKVHWAVWWIHQIGRIVGISGMRYLSNKNANKNFWIGSFSYLGEWDLPSDEIFVGGPPGSKNFPISVMVMIANSHMTISLKIHPFICKDTNKVPELLSQLSTVLLKKVEQI